MLDYIKEHSLLIVEALVGWWVTNIDFPAFMLMVLFTLGVWVLYRTQADPANKLDLADMLRDDSGKPSASRLCMFTCLGVTSWGLMYVLVKGPATMGVDATTLFLGYAAIWSGTKVANTLATAYMNKGAGRVTSFESPSDFETSLPRAVITTKPVTKAKVDPIFVKPVPTVVDSSRQASTGLGPPLEDTDVRPR